MSPFFRQNEIFFCERTQKRLRKRPFYAILYKRLNLRPCGQAVKTAPSHGAIPGSIPGKVTTVNLNRTTLWSVYGLGFFLCSEKHCERYFCILQCYIPLIKATALTVVRAVRYGTVVVNFHGAIPNPLKFFGKVIYSSPVLARALEPYIRHYRGKLFSLIVFVSVRRRSKAK